MELYNVAQAVADMAGRAPFRPAIIFPAGRDAEGRLKTVQFNFRQFNAEVDRYAHGFTQFGVKMGDRVLLMFRVGVELTATIFALAKVGAVPVIIDPGMGREAFLRCVADAQPTGLIALPIVHALRRLAPASFKTIRWNVVVGNPAWLADTTLAALRSPCADPFPVAPTTLESEAGVAFTSGSTGTPKGVVYWHGMFKAQIEVLRNVVHIEEGEVDLALLASFIVFGPALGITTIIPDMDPTKPAEINPAYVAEAIQTFGVTNTFGSPTIWKRVVPYCLEHDIRLPSLKRVLMAGAPAPPTLIQPLVEQILSPTADVITPFGATEAMPLTWMSGRDIVRDTAARTASGAGTCVGRAIPGVDLRVIRISDDPIPTWDDALVLPAGPIGPATVGEVVVKGAMVTREYLNRPDKTAAAKIRDKDGVWHRMGDLGYFDAEGRLWFCGRKAHRVETAEGRLLPVPCESIFNAHPAVARTALVGVGPRGQQRAVLVVELKPEHGRTPLERQKMTLELLALGTEHPHTRPIRDVLFYPDVFPTDVRHNAKIQREKLAVWAEERLTERPLASLRAARTLRDGVSYTGKRARRLGPALGVVGAILAVVLSLILMRRRSRNQ